ncbi:MAG: VWA domain-containing protein [Rikenellaceae bacterium]
MFRFESAQYLYLLLLIVPIIALYFFVKHRHSVRLKRFGNPDLIKQLSPFASWYKVKIKYVLTVVALAFVIIAIARPQLGSKLKQVKKSGVEIMAVVDVSNSMLAEDISPSRLERTKFALSNLASSLTEDRLGLIVFAGDAFVQLPITSDFVSAQNFVQYISPSMVSNQGTDIGKALSLAARSFSAQSDKSRAIILISDGEDHAGALATSAKTLSDMGIAVHVVGIGTPEGTPITIGGETMKDEDGNMVISRLAEKELQELAMSTGGSYIRASNRSIGLDEIVREIHNLESKEFSSMVFDEYNEQFQYILALALLFLIIEFVTLERKNQFIARLTIFNKKEKN